MFVLSEYSYGFVSHRFRLRSAQEAVDNADPERIHVMNDVVQATRGQHVCAGWLAGFHLPELR